MYKLTIATALLILGGSLYPAAKQAELPIVQTIVYGDTAGLLTLLHEGGNVAQPFDDGSTALHWAAVYSRHDLIPYLIAAGASIYNKDWCNRTPLEQALVYGNRETVSVLLNNQMLYDVDGLLRLAITHGTPESVAMLFDAGLSVNHVMKNGNSTVLHIAAAWGRSDLIPLLLSLRANCNAINDHCYTPLCLAAKRRDLKVMKQLLDAGAKITAAHADQTPLHTVAQTKRKGTCRAMQLLLQYVRSVDSLYDCLGETPLQVAVKTQNLTALRMLLAAGANPNACRNPERHTLQLAIISPSPLNRVVIKMLCLAGANENAIHDVEPLNTNHAALEELIERGVHLTQKQYNTLGPNAQQVVRTIRQNRMHEIKLFLQNRANLPRDLAGFTATFLDGVKNH